MADSQHKSDPPQAHRQAGLLGPKGMLLMAALFALVGFAAVYASLRPSDNAAGVAATASTAASSPSATATAPNAAATATSAAPGKATPAAEPAPKAAAAQSAGPGANPLSTGQVAGFVFKKEPEAMADIAFVDGAGQPKTLADWKGRTVLLNLWATWCAPCRKEMPALDRLEKTLGSDTFEVVALAIDRGGIAKAKAFLDEIKVTSLKLYVDPTAKLTAPLKVIGLPTTILIKDGKEIGRLVGPAEWDAPEAQRLIEAVMRK